MPHRIPLVRIVTIAFVVAITIAPIRAHAGRPPIVVPGDPSIIIERLPAGYAALAPTTAKEPPLLQIDRLLGASARTGDSRLAARAEALLARFPSNDTNPDVLRARAYSQQHRHQFDASLQLLNRLVARYPRDGDALMSRAQVYLVKGEIGRARSDCAQLAFAVDASRGTLCAVSLSMRIGQLDTASNLLDRWLAQVVNGNELRRYALVMRAEIASRAGVADADTWFQHALALGLQDVRTLAAYARHLRAKGRYAEALRLLADAPNSDSLQLERALAAHFAHVPQAQALANSLGQRYADAHAVGTVPELREEAEYLLTLRGDAAGALTLALKNFQTQRDVEDLSILRRAAIAAGHPEALQPMQAWAQLQQVPLEPLPVPGA